MIKIIADSTCDLSDEVLARCHISIAPLIISGAPTFFLRPQ